MKSFQLLPPLAAVIAGCVWLANLESSKDSLDHKNTRLRDRITAAKATTDDASGPSAIWQRTPNGGSSRTGKLSSTKPNEWRILAEGILREKSEGIEDPRMELRLATRLAKMSAEEMLAAYDEIAASDMAPDELIFLRNQFFNAASEKDPERTLRHFDGLLSGEETSMRGSVSTAFHKWFFKDPATATAWFDETIAAGKFESKRLDGQNQTLLDFTTPVIQAQLASDPAASLARLKTLPEGQRVELLQKFSEIAQGTELAFADLVRQGLPENQRETAFLNATTLMAIQQGFAKVGEFLDTIGATPEERSGIAQTTACAGLAQRMTRNDQANPKALVHGMREWLARQAPHEADRISGTALAVTVQSIGFEKAAALVAELHAETGSDELLAGFLDRAAMQSHPAETIAMANQIKDPALRDKVIGQRTSAPGNGP